jgi:signal peptidase II
MRIRNYYFWLAAIISLVLDTVSKQAISKHLQVMETIPLIPNFFHLTYLRNSGAAFSLFQGHEWLRWLSLIVSLVLVVFGLIKSFTNIWEQLGFGLILAGAAGNGIDRVFFGSVVDFIDLRFINFAVFNWADVSINLGIICLLIFNIKYQSPRANSR